MSAKSKDQQRAAAIALKAKRDGKVDDLPAGAAKNMAKSMSEKELDKFASTKHKGLPENKPNESKNWAGTSLLETFFAEEMLDTDEEGEAITSDKSTRDQIEDAERDHEDDTGWDAYDDSWDSKVRADAPIAQAGRPMGSNVTGAARVAYENKNPILKAGEKECPKCHGSGLKDGHGDTMSWRETPALCDHCNGRGKISKKTKKESRDPNSLDILFEGPSNREYYTSDEYYDLTHSSDWEDERFDDPQAIAQGEVGYERLEQVESSIRKKVIENLDWAKDNPGTGRFGKTETPSLKLAIELAEDELGDLDEWGSEAQALYDAYGDKVPVKDQQSPAFASRVMNVASKEIGREAWEEWSRGRELGEQALGGLDAEGWADDWGPGIDSDPGTTMVGPLDPPVSDMDTKLHSSLIDDMVDHVITHHDLHGKLPNEWNPEDLLADFEYDYSVSVSNPDDIEAAETAISRAAEEIEAPEEVRFESKRWQKLAGLKLLREDTPEKVNKVDKDKSRQPLQELNSAQANRYVKRMAKHKWEWLDVAAMLKDQYGLSLYEIEELKPVFDAETERLQNEAMLGGVSNGGPAPGHRAKMNEDSDLEFLAQGKAHRVDIFNVRDELAGLAYEIAGEIQGMHLDKSDRKTEKMVQNRLESMYRHLLKLKNLTN